MEVLIEMLRNIDLDKLNKNIIRQELDFIAHRLELIYIEIEKWNSSILDNDKEVVTLPNGEQTDAGYAGELAEAIRKILE